MKNVLLIGGGVVLVMVIAVVGIVVGFNNSAVSQENGIEATWKDSQVQYDAFWKKVKETGQVTDRYADDFKELFLGSMEARYDGKDPALNFIMEANPALPPDNYERLQTVIEEGRNDFARTQRTLVDKQRAYETHIEKFPNSSLAGMLGFPRPVTGEYAPPEDTDGDGTVTVLDYKIVTSSKTQEVFETGREDNPVDVFGDG
jgi:hypothetical protein